MADKVLTCVYCGKEYPVGTRSHGDKELTDHIKTCPKHPLSEARKHISALIRAFTNIRPCDRLTEESIRLQYLTDKQIKVLLDARDFLYAD